MSARLFPVDARRLLACMPSARHSSPDSEAEAVSQFTKTLQNLPTFEFATVPEVDFKSATPLPLAASRRPSSPEAQPGVPIIGLCASSSAARSCFSLQKSDGQAPNSATLSTPTRRRPPPTPPPLANRTARRFCSTAAIASLQTVSGGGCKSAIGGRFLQRAAPAAGARAPPAR